jgi:CDP-diacylglycerol--glycerol-3-phosphate 3-phosphatidyltransferase
MTTRDVSPVRVPRFGQSALATPANFVTVARMVVAVPTVVLIADSGATWAALGLWFLLSVTDKLDGWLARRDGATRSGAFLDPIADKLIVLGGLAALASRGDAPWLPVVLIGGRELGISLYRAVLGRRGISMPARQLGKWKATVQFVAVGLMLLPWTADHDAVAVAALWVATAFTLWSAIDIVRARRPPAATAA